jgi:hypothetical protein
VREQFKWVVLVLRKRCLTLDDKLRVVRENGYLLDAPSDGVSRAGRIIQDQTVALVCTRARKVHSFMIEVCSLTQAIRLFPGLLVAEIHTIIETEKVVELSKSLRTVIAIDPAAKVSTSHPRFEDRPFVFTCSDAICELM